MATVLAPPDLARAARLFHALSDETRLEIVRRLSACECCVCELTDAMEAAQSRLSFHLKTLKTAGVVTDRRVGRWVYYSLVPEALEEIAALSLSLKPAECEAGACGPVCAEGSGCCG